MPKSGQQQQAVERFRAQLRAHEAQQERVLENAYAHVLKTLQPALDKLYGQMADELAKGEKIQIQWLLSANRLVGIKKLISGEIDHFGLLSRLQVTQAQQFAVSLGQKSAMELLNTTVPPGIHYTFGVPHPAAIMNIVGATSAGSPLAELFDGFGSEAAQKAANALITGITLGDNPRTVAGSVQDALGVSRNRALTISRDSLNNAYRAAAVETYKANSDVVESMIRVADMSSRTCAACIFLTGTVYALDADPGFHTCDRCSLVPKTRSWAEILSPMGIDTSSIPETSIEIPSGSSWFAQQDAATQQSILGSKAAYDLYAGGTPLSAFVGHTHDSKWGTSVRVKTAKEVTKR